MEMIKMLNEDVYILKRKINKLEEKYNDYKEKIV